MDKIEFDKARRRLKKYAALYENELSKFQAMFTEISGLDNWNQIDGDAFIDSFEWGCGSPTGMDYDEFISESESCIGIMPKL